MQTKAFYLGNVGSDIVTSKGANIAFPESLSALQVYVRSAETLAALGAKLGALTGNISPNQNLLAKLDAVQSLNEPDIFDDLNDDDMTALYGFVVAALHQMLHLTELPGDGSEGWTYENPSILEGQGRSSRIVTRLVTDYANREQTLGKTLLQPTKFLDVGSGVGWISLSMARQWPNLHATGIDILEPALELAGANLDECGLADRVQFRNQNVLDLTDPDVFDLAFIPLIFIPEEIVAAALQALARSVKPDGWLFVGAFRIPDDPKLAALNELRTTLSGGRVWNLPEVTQMIEGEGFDVLEDIGLGSPITLMAARRRTI